MENFIAYNPVKLHFGKDVVNNLGEAASAYGKRVLFIYGKGSVKKYGYYDKVKAQLDNAGMEVFEYGGIKPNPIIEDARKAMELGITNKVDLIVALGGGSVIDTAKMVGLGIANNIDPWLIISSQKPISEKMPLINVLTLAATGTEMNAAAVLQNNEAGQKVGWGHPLNFPSESFLDPSYTLSVPKNYTSFGIVDLIAHAFEAYFGKGESSLIDDITFAIIRDALNYGPRLLENLDDYSLREAIMLDATLALNGLTMYGKQSGDWGVHSMGHEISLLFDTAHGATLSIAYPAWLKLQGDRIPERITKMGEALFGAGTVDDSISELEKAFKKLLSPIRLSEIGLDEDDAAKLLAQYNKNKVSGMFHSLGSSDHEKLIDLMR
ncbi:MAG: iron-containing alcohol dehydrogenase [Chlorobi bacterium]|nr:iron-containing alcohol dehydrogenase [Chlorobiota bacterium]